MKIAVQEISEEGLTFIFDSGEWLPESVAATGPVHAALTLKRKGSRILINGELDLRILDVCDRCLSDITSSIASEFKTSFELQNEECFEREHQLDHEEIDTEFFTDSEFDVTEFLRQQLLLSLPVKRLCSEECRGLCSHCGVDLNKESCSCREKIDSPFSSLAGLIK
jgi:uncharacterized protein